VSKALLVVDDEDLVLQFIDAVLSRCNFKVVTAKSGTDALRICENEALHPEMALLDVIMPDMTGPVLLQRLLGRFPDMRFLFMSGYGLEDISSMLHVPLTDRHLIRKPFTPSRLVGAVDQILR
jgi:DNA-binding NtrC family response regulator